jgi:uncharacterized membrane protein HdeD (DUF308 family)
LKVTVVTTAQKVGNEFDEVSIGGSRPKHRHWKLELVEGAILVVLGCVAGFVPFGFGIAIFMWLMVIGGIAGLITTLVMRKAPGFWWSLASAILAIGIATVMFAVPELAVVGLPLLLICFLVLEGIVTVMLALEHLRHLSCRRGLDARQRTRRFVLGCFHRGGPAGDRFLGIKSCLSR